MEFNEEFYSKVVRLMRQGSVDAKNELLKLNKQVLQYYDQMGWTRFPFDTPSTPITSSANSTPSSKSQQALDTSLSRISVIQSTCSTIDLASNDSMLGLEQESSSGSDAPTKSPPKKRVKVLSSTDDEQFPLIPSPTSTPSITPSSAVPKLNLPKNTPPQNSPQVECSICGSAFVDEDNVISHCSECSKRFHQLCHDPPLKTNELSDPRFIFRCQCCVKKRNDLAKSSSPGAQIGPLSVPLSVKARNAAKKRSVDSGDKNKLFDKNSDNKSSESQGNPNVKGIASMAEAFLAKHKNKANGGSSGVLKTTPSSSGVRPLGSPTSALTGLAKLGQGGVGLGKLTASALPTQNTNKTVASHATPMQSANQRLMAMKKKAAKLSK